MANAPRTYRLLIVDDDDCDRRHYGKLLGGHGAGICQATHAVDGESGLHALQANAFDCVLLDFNLPDMNGLHFLDQAAVDGEIPCAVVLITGHGNEAIAVQAMKCGAQDYLVKDQVNVNSLWRAVTQAVTQTELRLRLSRSLRDLTATNVALEQEAAIRKTAEIELRAAKELAEQASRAKTRFVAMVTHELRTPLNGILGYAQLLRAEAGLTQRQDEHVGAMMLAGQHLLEMIERVLDFASIENAELELHPEPVSVGDLTERCIAFVRPMADQRKLNLRALVAQDAPRHIVADPARLRQVLLNLLGNAVKFTAAGYVELRLLAGDTPGGLRVEVIDTGCGVAEASRDRLFRDFERLDAASSVEGAGLGLAVAARIINMMSGRIEYRENPAGGSVFWFELPPTDPTPAARPEPTPISVDTCLPSQRLLLVDDIEMNRAVVSALLSTAGHIVVLAESGAQALEIAANERFDLILMDVRMPGMDGLEATRRLRALPGFNRQVPILALTANTFPEQMVSCKEAGMNGHISKPVNQETLLQAIADAIAAVPPVPANDQRSPDQCEPAAEPSLLRLDRAILDRTLGVLPQGEIANCFGMLRDRKQELLRLLDLPDHGIQQIESAHALASGAGMFGFTALSQLARQFERALEQSAPLADSLAQRLRLEIPAALADLDKLMRDNQEPAT